MHLLLHNILYIICFSIFFITQAYYCINYNIYTKLHIRYNHIPYYTKYKEVIFIKKEFRKKIIFERNTYSNDFIDTYSKSITDTLLNLDIFSTSSTIMTYLDFNNEVKTEYMINKLISMGKNILVPITIKENNQLLPSQIKDLSSEIKLGTFGIREPKSEFVRPYSPKNIDILIVPAVAFDVNRYRLGYGGGFYDRFISLLREDTLVIGIAFDFQIFDTIPKEDHDAQMDLIITESRILK